MDKWYISVQNKAKGPYTDLQMRKKIQEGEVDGETLAYREGEQDWQPLEDQEIWSPTFSKKEDFKFVEKETDGKEWVLLVENPIKAGDYKQEGPFTEKEIREKIDSGDVYLKDFCWKPGMESWTQLVKVPELSLTRKDKILFDKSDLGETVFANELEPPKKRKTEVDFNFQTDGGEVSEDFIDPNQEDVKAFKNKFSKNKIKQRVQPLASVKEELEYKKEISTYLASIAVVFLMSFVFGYYNNKFVLKSFESLQTGVSNFINYLAPQPAASYIFLKQSVLNKNVFHIRSDLKEGQFLKVSVYDEKGTSVLTTKNTKFVNVKVDRLGMAQINLKNFMVQPFKSYRVTSAVGKFKATKWYTHTRN